MKTWHLHIVFWQWWYTGLNVHFNRLIENWQSIPPPPRPDSDNQWLTQPVGTPIFLNFKCQRRCVDGCLLSLQRESWQRQDERGKYLISEFGSFLKAGLNLAEWILLGYWLFPEESHGSRSGSAEPAHHCWGDTGGPHLGLRCICAALAFGACKGVLLVRSQMANHAGTA